MSIFAELPPPNIELAVPPSVHPLLACIHLSAGRDELST